MAERELGTLEVRRIRFDKIRAAEYNPRVDLLPGDREWVEIEASLDEFGLVEPLVWNEATGNLVGGHQRLKIMKAKGRVEADFSVIHEPDPDRERALNIRLNGSQGRWDVGRLAAMLDDSEELRRLAGFAESDLQALRELSEVSAPLGFYEHLEQWSARPEPRAEGGPEDPGPQITRAEELREKWGVESGQLWRAGEHRVVCGDSTDPTVAELALGGGEAECLWADPPYGVAYQDSMGLAEARARHRRVDGAIVLGDAASPCAIEALVAAAVMGAPLSAGGSFYVAAPPGPLLAAFIAPLVEEGWLRQCLVWVKQQMVFGRSDYHYRHEMILYGWKPGAPHRWYAGRDRDSVFCVDRPSASVEHPTMKPVELVARCLENSVEAGSVVYDPFLGSGTTLVACEQSGRLGRGVEIDPGYVAVSLERLAGMGLDVERVE